MSTRLHTYTLRIMGPERAPGTVVALSLNEQEAMQGAIQDAEDVVNDALPEGYYCKIEDTDGLQPMRNDARPRLAEASENAARYFGVK